MEELRTTNRLLFLILVCLIPGGFALLLAVASWLAAGVVVALLLVGTLILLRSRPARYIGQALTWVLMLLAGGFILFLVGGFYWMAFKNPLPGTEPAMIGIPLLSTGLGWFIWSRSKRNRAGQGNNGR